MDEAKYEINCNLYKIDFDFIINYLLEVVFLLIFWHRNFFIKVNFVVMNSI